MKVLTTRETPQTWINLLTEHKDLKLDYRKDDPPSPTELKKAKAQLPKLI